MITIFAIDGSLLNKKKDQDIDKSIDFYYYIAPLIQTIISPVRYDSFRSQSPTGAEHQILDLKGVPRMIRSFLSLCLVAAMVITANGAEDKKQPGTASFVVSSVEGCALSLESPGSDSFDQPAVLPAFDGLTLGENDEVTVSIQKGVLAAKKPGSMTLVVENIEDGLLYLVPPDWDGLSMPSTLPAFEGLALAKNDPVIVTVVLKKKGVAGKGIAHTGGPDCKCRQCKRVSNIAAQDEAKLRKILTTAQGMKTRSDLKKLTPELLDFFGDDKAAAEAFMRKVDKMVKPEDFKGLTLEDILRFAN